jgi:hypothetical protein
MYLKNPDGTLAFTDHKRSAVGGEPAITYSMSAVTTTPPSSSSQGDSAITDRLPPLSMNYNGYSILHDPDLNLFAIMEQLPSFSMIYHNDSGDGDGYSIPHEPHSNPLDNATIYPPSPVFIEQLQADMDMNQFVPYDVIEPSPVAPAGHMSNTSLISASFREPQSQPNAILTISGRFQELASYHQNTCSDRNQHRCSRRALSILTTRHITTIRISSPSRGLNVLK